MSAENVDIIRRGYEEFIATGEPTEDIMAPEFVWDMSTFGAWPERQTYEGIEGMREFLATWVGAWDDFHIDLEELTDLGDHVLARLRKRGRGKGSGVEVERELFQLFTFRDDRIARLRMYEDEKEALEAAGPRE